MTIEQMLVLRYEWESLVSYRKTYDLPSYDGTIDNLRHFVKCGGVKNRFRKNFDKATKVAEEILYQHDRFMESLDQRLAG